MKKAFSFFGIFCLLLFSSCMTIDYSEAEYYSVEEVIEAWEEGIYDYDLDQQMSVYWPDVYGAIFWDEEGYPPEFGNREELWALMEHFKDDDFDLGDFEFPPYEVVTKVEDEVVTVYYYYEEMMREEFLTLVRRGELWGIQEHYFHYFEALPVNYLTHWCDENQSGFIEPWESTVLVTAVHTLLFDPHRVEFGLDEAFDSDGNGYIDEEEFIFARSYFFSYVLPRTVESVEWFGQEWIDLDWDGVVTQEEIESVSEYLLSWQSNTPLDRPDDDPLVRRLDENRDNFLDEHERDFFFWHLTGMLVQFYHHEDPFKDNPVELTVVERSFNSETSLDKIKGKRIAVVDISSETEKINEETRKGLVFFVENSFVNTGQVKVVDRKTIDKIYEENRFQSSGLTDEETAVEIGKIVGAEIIVTGSVTSVGTNFYLQLRMIDVKTGEVVASSLGEAKIENEFLNMSSMAVERLF